MPTLEGNVEQTKPLQIRGASDYAANAQFRVHFADVTTMGNALEDYCKGIDFLFDMVFTHDNVGALTLPEELVTRVLESLILRTTKGHPFYDLGNQAGYALYVLNWAFEGRRFNRQAGGGSISLPAATNTAVRFKLHVPFQNGMGVERDDWNVPLRDLTGAAIVCNWGNGALGGMFDTGADNVRIVSGTVRATIDLVGRQDTDATGEWRYAPRFSVSRLKVASKEDRLPLANRAILALIEVPVMADQSMTVNRITMGSGNERDLVTVITDGLAVVDRQDSRDLTQRWNRTHAADAESELPHAELGTTPWIPLLIPGRRPAKVTQVPGPYKDPTLRVTGTDETPTILMITQDLPELGDVVDAARDAKVEVPAGFNAKPEDFLDAKTASKATAEPGRGVFRRLPVRLRQKKTA